ncbi:50S ribosomal protein L32 [Candidatus Saganbacteria bacterium CG08_land_8_20_14_0_20_45_16]|uniref:Large ribosomal subunit protein bL32 n=1 Tax=Candidatus Saganbacteria bacterium CG08_land_8_20_14_0_20_45_16 TaxID=2014293 RepID=A0A2H0Y079_UNCSA|nr:MAG: 50S ribosomal protein L32 [Candidatus Saganbacteria bacterium CG08_land_8_20_14_0_20_45_16]
MPVPKKRHSNCRQGKRRASNYRLTPLASTRCPACGAATLPHHVCSACGSYKDRQVKKIKDKSAKKAKGKEKE